MHLYQVSLRTMNLTLAKTVVNLTQTRQTYSLERYVARVTSTREEKKAETHLTAQRERPLRSDVEALCGNQENIEQVWKLIMFG